MRLAITTMTGPAEWGLPIDWRTVATFELELQEQAKAADRMANR